MRNLSTRFRCVLAFIVGAPLSAFALTPDDVPEIELFLSGSTAQDGALENLMRLKSGVAGSPNICREGTLDVYHGKINGTRKHVFYCLTSGKIPGVPAGTRLAVHKSSGGSGEGVSHVAESKLVTFIDLSDLPDTRSCRKPARVLHTRDLAAYSVRRDCGGTGKKAVPLAGISDIEPQLIAEGVAGLATRSQAQLVWGLPVTKNLRNALQAIQGLVPSSVPHDHPSRERQDTMPTLSHAQIASIFAGTLTRWDELYDRAGIPISVSPDLEETPPGSPDLSGTSPGAYRPDPETGNDVYICRRIASSGTQAAYEIHYLRHRCVPGAPGFRDPDDGSSIVGGGNPNELVRKANPAGTVFAGVGTSDVRACLDAHEQHNRWAIGMFSTENVGNNASREFRHIKVDGYAPTLDNAYDGRWNHVSEPSLQWRQDFDTPIHSIAEGRVLVFLSQNLSRPRVVRSLNSAFEHSWGRGGYLALPGDGIDPPAPPVSTAKLTRQPVASLTKSRDGMPRNCDTSLLKRPSSVAF